MFLHRTRYLKTKILYLCCLSASALPLSAFANKVENHNSLTAQDQAQGSPADLETTRNIRKQIMQDDHLSTDAKNVQIITLRGKVTLKGMMQNNQEQSTVVAIAQKVAGPQNVHNQTTLIGTVRN